MNVLQSCGSTQLTEESAPVLPTLRFSRKFGLIFCGVAVFFKTCGLLVFGLVFCKFMFCRLLFLILWHFCCFNLLLKAYWACFYENLLILGLFFRICLPAFSFNFVADFSFCWIFMPTPDGLVFWWNYLFLACFSNLLACFCKLTWHHRSALVRHQQQEPCLSKRTYTYQIDADHSLHNCVCGALSKGLKLLKRYLQITAEKERLCTIALMILHRDVKENNEKVL